MPPTPRFSPSQGLKDVSRRMSLELKLPLLMSMVLATVLGIALIVTVTTLQRAAVLRAAERLYRATRQLATLGAATIPTQHTRFLQIANDSAVRRALAEQPGSATAAPLKSALERLVLPTDSGLPVELWSADGRRLAFVGNDVRGTMKVERGKPELPIPIESTIPSAGRQDSFRIGPLYGENNGVFFWFVMPVKDGRRTIGYITQQRKLALGANAVRTLRELSGDSVSLYYRNFDNSFWASGLGIASTGLVAPDTARGTARDTAGEEVLFHEERIGTTPLVVGMSMSSRAVLSRTYRTLVTLLLLSIVLLIGGTVAAWLIGRSVARPLGEIARAAGRLAEGDWNARVPSTGELEVRRLADSFNHMAEEMGSARLELERQTHEAQAANNAKSEFLTTMSHELRTPLNAIGGYADLLSMELRGPISESQRRDLERIKASQQHLLGLISSVLDLARIEAGRVTYAITHVAIDPFLAGLDALVAPQASAKSLRLEYLHCPPELVAMADREKLRQVLLNLLSNAIRHTPAGGTITLSAEGRSGRVAIVVRDTGPGIPEDKREIIFEPFVQLDRSLTQTIEGLGLGLAISRDLARGMSGDLVVDGANGAGATFILTLPRGRLEMVSSSGVTDEYPVINA